MQRLFDIASIWYSKEDRGPKSPYFGWMITDLDWLHRCWWRMLKTKSLGDNFGMKADLDLIKNKRENDFYFSCFLTNELHTIEQF